MALFASFRYVENSCLLLLGLAISAPVFLACLSWLRYRETAPYCALVLGVHAWAIALPVYVLTFLVLSAEHDLPMPFDPMVSYECALLVAYALLVTAYLAVLFEAIILLPHYMIVSAGLLLVSRSARRRAARIPQPLGPCSPARGGG